MAKFVSLLTWTDQGIKSAKETINRAKAARQAFEKAGGKMTECLWTMGKYDVVVVFEAPDNETATRMMLATGMAGNVHTVTMPAMDESAMSGILNKI